MLSRLSRAFTRGPASPLVERSAAAARSVPWRARLCSTAKPSSWDAASMVHGRPPAPEPPPDDEESAKSKPSAPPPPPPPRPPPSGAGTFGGQEKADLLQFQVYVRQRLAELQTRMPQPLSVREQAELSFLEDKVVQDAMPKSKRQLRDPLRDVATAEISHTNLPLLSRFVSEAGAILPRKLTGVNARKQRRLSKAIKRAHQLALLPRTWKLPKYRHASYADQYSKPERRDVTMSSDDQFRDPPDLRFPNQWERTRGALDIDLSRLSRSTKGIPRQDAKPLGQPR